MNALAAAWRFVSRLIGRNLREWAEWAEREPEAAARVLELIAEVVHERSKVRRWAWLRRRDEAMAIALRDQAADLRDAAERSTKKELRAVCRVRPGTYGRE